MCIPQDLKNAAFSFLLSRVENINVKSNGPNKKNYLKTKTVKPSYRSKRVGSTKLVA